MANKSKTVELDLFDRTLLKSIFVEKRDNIGDLDTLRVSINVLNKIEISDEEASEFELVQTPSQIKWNPEKNKPKEFSFESREFDLIERFVKNKQDWTLDLRNLLFAEKFGVKLGEDDSENDES